MRIPPRHAVERWDGCAGWGAIDDHDLLQLWIVREEMAKCVRHGAGVAFFIWRGWRGCLGEAQDIACHSPLNRHTQQITCEYTVAAMCCLR